MNDFVQIQELYDEGLGPREYGEGEFYNSSRLHIYWNERELMGTPMEDSGAYLRLGAQALAQFGACRESLWPYQAGNVFRQPDASAVSEALEHRATAYMRVDTDSDRKRCLSDGFPFVFGFTVFDSFESAELAGTGLMPMPGPQEGTLGGHAVACVGYDDIRRVWIIRNSWGESWGDRGYYYMPYDFLGNPGLADDFWTLRA